MAALTKPLLFIPGIGGNELLWQPPFFGTRKALWVNLTKLAVGGLQWLALDPSGTGPLGFWHPELTAGPAVGDYYGSFKDWLRRGGYTVEDAWIDWRKPLSASVDAVVSDIRRLGASEPVRIVTHSRGALVALEALHVLAASGELGKVRQGVSLGPPWRGSYAPIGYLGGWDSFALVLQILSTAAGIGSGGVLFGLPVRVVVQSWPGLYELLPDPATATAAGDTDIDSVYNAFLWQRAGVPISPTHLANARARWATAPGLPPGVRWASIAGNGYATRGPSVGAITFDLPGSVAKKFDGDGTVPFWSSSATSGTVIPFNATHSEMCNSGAIMDTIQGLLAS